MTRLGNMGEVCIYMLWVDQVLSSVFTLNWDTRAVSRDTHKHSHEDSCCLVALNLVIVSKANCLAF